MRLSNVLMLGLIVAVLAVVMFVALPTQMPFGALILLEALFTLTPIECWLARPLAYEITEDAVKVRRRWPFGVVNIPLSGLHEIREIYVGELPLMRMWKIFASGGCFGYFGTFWSRSLGFIWMSCTNLSNMVLLHNRRKSILSPANPSEFVSEVKRRMGIA